MVEIPTPKPYIFMISVTRQIKCLIAQAPGVIPHPLPEVNFLMVEIPTLKPYIYSLVSYLFIKQDQIIMTCNSAVASDAFSIFEHQILNFARTFSLSLWPQSSLVPPCKIVNCFVVILPPHKNLLLLALNLVQYGRYSIYTGHPN